MKSQVFFADQRDGSGRNLLDKVDSLLSRTGLKGKIGENETVAIKLHFGERGNTTFVPPYFVRRVVDQVKRYRGKPFLTDTNTLYRGSRSEAISHLLTAYEHGFAYSVVDAPVLIADGLRGNSAVKVRIDKPLFRTVPIARDIFMADVLLCVTHFTGHELSGFGGALKNLGMGCASREGKLSQHSNISPRVKEKSCSSCRRCLQWCPAEAISMIEPDIEKKQAIASIDPKRCIGCGECILTCPTGAIRIQWNESSNLFQKKMVEHACGAIQNKKEKAIYLNFLTQITPACDCNHFSDPPMVNDIGILCSEDPIAIDQASVDLVNGEEGKKTPKLQRRENPGGDKFRAVYPEIDSSIQLVYGEEIGIGTRTYELIRI